MLASGLSLTKTTFTPRVAEDLDKWEENEVCLLLSCHSDHKHLINNNDKTTKKAIFEKVSSSFNEKSNQKVTWDQCHRKWLELGSKCRAVTEVEQTKKAAQRTWIICK